MRKNPYGFMVLFFMAFLLVGCNVAPVTTATTIDPRTIPVYQGMTWSDMAPTALSWRNAATGGIDQDDPFGDLDPGTIDDLLGDAFPIEAGVIADYYALPGDTAYLTVQLLNPDAFEILSFTLNGTKYQSYQFETGSDSEHLILAVTLPEISGIEAYTIDEIKYVDGTVIKNAVFAGDQTVTVGITHQAVPSCAMTGAVVTATSFTADAEIADPAGLIAQAGDHLAVYLYDGVTMILQAAPVVGQNVIRFDKLVVGTLYQYAVVALFDVVDGTGQQIVILQKEAFYSTEIVALDNVLPTQTAIGFDLTITDAEAVGALSALALYQGDTLIESLADLNGRTFAGLLSNNEYTVRATYAYDLSDDQGPRQSVVELTVRTVAKITPTIAITGVTPTQTAIGFALIVTDPDAVGSLTSIILYQGETLVQSLTALDDRAFVGLRSDTGYRLEATYHYDLNDGAGTHDDVVAVDTVTLPKATPVVTVDNVVPTQTSLSFGVTVTDPDAIGTITAIGLYQGETLIEALADLNLRLFEGLLSNNGYTIRVTLDYDLNDAVGVQQVGAERTISTLAKATPTVLINAVVPTQTSVGFAIVVTDPDAVGSLSSIELHQGMSLIEALGDLNARTFADLFSNNAYVIRVAYVYDLNDGVGARVAEVQNGFTTLAKATPVVLIDGLVSAPAGLAFALTVTDPDAIGTIVAITLFQGLTVIEDLADLNLRTFAPLPSNHDYTIDVAVTYDLNDGVGVRTLHQTLGLNTGFYGAGTELDPYLLYAMEDLLRFMDAPGAYYLMMNDIDMVGTYWIPQTATFTGSFDGNGFALLNLTMDTDHMAGYTGDIAFFHNVGDTGQILRLAIVNAVIRAKNHDRVAVLAASFAGFLSEVSVQGRITAESDYLFVGGMVATFSGHIQNAFANVIIEIDVGSFTYAGGVVAISSGIIENVYANGELNLSNNGGIDMYVGGIAGFHDSGVVVGSFSTKKIDINVTTQYYVNAIRSLFGHSNGSPASHIDLYYFDNQEIRANGVVFVPVEEYGTMAAATNLNQQSWYTGTLGWDPLIWNFDVLDFENGVLPVLRNVGN